MTICVLSMKQKVKKVTDANNEHMWSINIRFVGRIAQVMVGLAENY